MFRFPAAKILDYRSRQAELGKSGSSFEVVVKAHLGTMETKADDSGRLNRKIEQIKSLYRRGFRKQDILNLYRF